MVWQEKNPSSCSSTKTGGGGGTVKEEKKPANPPSIPSSSSSSSSSSSTSDLVVGKEKEIGKSEEKENDKEGSHEGSGDPLRPETLPSHQNPATSSSSLFKVPVVYKPLQNEEKKEEDFMNITLELDEGGEDPLFVESSSVDLVRHRANEDNDEDDDDGKEEKKGVRSTYSMNMLIKQKKKTTTAITTGSYSSSPTIPLDRSSPLSRNNSDNSSKGRLQRDIVQTLPGSIHQVPIRRSSWSLTSVLSNEKNYRSPQRSVGSFTSMPARPLSPPSIPSSKGDLRMAMSHSREETGGNVEEEEEEEEEEATEPQRFEHISSLALNVSMEQVSLEEEEEEEEEETPRKDHNNKKSEDEKDVFINIADSSSSSPPTQSSREEKEQESSGKKRKRDSKRKKKKTTGEKGNEEQEEEDREKEKEKEGLVLSFFLSFHLNPYHENSHSIYSPSQWSFLRSPRLLAL